MFGKNFLGVVPRDRIPGRTKHSFLICNLDEADSERGGSHWVCRYVTRQGKVLWHDPLGVEGAEQAEPLVDQLSGVQWTEDDAEQHPDEDNCGQRCLAALRIAKEMGPDAFLSL